MAGITDLPTEILVNILEHPTFPTESLYFLALLSRRLHFIALPIYFSRNGVDVESATVTLLPHGLDPLSALQISLFVSSMEKLTCLLPHPSCTTISPVLTQLRRLETFISRLTSIQEVRLDLGSPHGCLSTGPDKELEAWSSHFGGLLSCIVQRGCRALTVTGGTCFINAYELDDPVSSTKHIRRVIGKMLAPPVPTVLGFKRHPKQGKAHHGISLSSMLSTTAEITSLTVDSATSDRPAGLEWTLAALRHSPITSLSIAMFRFYPSLPPPLPNITTLSLTHLDVDGELDIITFISQLPHLTHLHLTHHPLWGPRGHQVKGVTLPLWNLVTLRAPPNLIEHFLSLIQSICVLWAHLNLPLFARFMSSIIHKLELRRLAPQLSLWTESMSSNMELNNALLMNSGFDMEETYPTLEHLLSLFSGIKHLSLEIRKEFPEAWAVQLTQSVRATEFLTRMEVNGKTYDLLTSSAPPA
ncbi:hypothetical protein B0H14DRAFT_2693892 [Mycena olivaceomarginata]|nr:hypothetical protein B0H14DRAFT_2693892 [Mycena olivaceomarginata]